MTSHPLPRACRAQDPVHCSRFLAGALKKEALRASDNSACIVELDAESGFAPDLEALPGPPGQKQRAELCKPQTHMWDSLKSCQVLILHPRAMEFQVPQTRQLFNPGRPGL